MSVISRTTNFWLPLSQIIARLRSDGAKGGLKLGVRCVERQGVSPGWADAEVVDFGLAAGLALAVRPGSGWVHAFKRSAVAATVPSHLPLRIASWT
jgi:hypothetical protein